MVLKKCFVFWGNHPGNVEYVEYVECFLSLEGRSWPISSQTFNIFNIFNITAERNFFWRPGLEHIQQIQHYSRKIFFCLKNVSFSCNVECWVPLRHLGCSKWVSKFKNIQHIQHIQHFRRKRHVLEKRLLNIFNISAERSFVWKKASFSCNVECWVPLRWLGCSKGVYKF